MKGNMAYCLDQDHGRRVLAGGHICYPLVDEIPGESVENHEFLYLIEGRGTFCIEDEELYGEPGDVILIPAGYRRRGIVQRVPVVRVIFIRFSAAKGDRSAGIDETPPDGALIVPALLRPNSPMIFNYFQGLAKNQVRESPYKDYKNTALLNLLILELAECYHENTHTPPPPPPMRKS
jgi:hypothetical protein